MSLNKSSIPPPEATLAEVLLYIALNSLAKAMPSSFDTSSNCYISSLFPTNARTKLKKKFLL
jgi:hypothetical protein